MTKAYNGLNSIKVNVLEAGVCPICSRLLVSEKCDHETTMEIEQWRAAHFAAEQDLANEKWDARHPETITNLTHTAYMEADEPVDEATRQTAEVLRDNNWLNSPDWQEEAEADHVEWLDEKATRESVRP